MARRRHQHANSRHCRFGHRRHGDGIEGGGHAIAVTARPRRRRDPAPLASARPDFTGLCIALLQLIVETALTFARTRRREVRNEPECANLHRTRRSSVAPSPRRLKKLRHFLGINIFPSHDFCIFSLAPGCSLIHDWLQPDRVALWRREAPPARPGKSADGLPGLVWFSCCLRSELPRWS